MEKAKYSNITLVISTHIAINILLHKLKSVIHLLL